MESISGYLGFGTRELITCLILFCDHQTQKEKEEYFILESVLDLQNYCKDRSKSPYTSVHLTFVNDLEFEA